MPNEHYGPGLSAEGIVEFWRAGERYLVRQWESGQAIRRSVLASIDNSFFPKKRPTAMSLSPEIKVENGLGQPRAFRMRRDVQRDSRCPRLLEGGAVVTSTRTRQ